MTKFKVGQRYRVGHDGWKESGNIIEITNVYENPRTTVVSYKTIKGEAMGYCRFEAKSLFAKTLRLINQKSIHIYTDGKTTTAILKNGKDTIKKAQAKCSPDDEFNFDEGARLALERLLGVNVKGCIHASYRVEDNNIISGTITRVNVNDDITEAIIAGIKQGLNEKYNAKLVCVDDHCAPNFTKGKIYKVVDGILYGDDDEGFGSDYDDDEPFESLDQINDIMAPDFIELNEE